eukprot:scaffold56774_cov67-Phaeocystis_antarctica.AAC.3
MSTWKARSAFVVSRFGVGAHAPAAGGSTAEKGVRTPSVTAFCCGLVVAAVVAAVPLPRAESTCGAVNWYRPAAPSSRRLTVTCAQRPRAPQGGLLCPRLPSASLLSSRAYHQRTSSRSQPLHGRHLSSLDSPLPACPKAVTTAPWSPQPGTHSLT